jgi:hypothetical protein
MVGPYDLASVNMLHLQGFILIVESQGPILHPAQLTFYTDPCFVASFQLAQSVLFPQSPRVGKLRNDLAPKGAVRQKEEVCSGANVPWCYFAVSENNSATNQAISCLK